MTSGNVVPVTVRLAFVKPLRVGEASVTIKPLWSGLAHKLPRPRAPVTTDGRLDVDPFGAEIVGD